MSQQPTGQNQAELESSQRVEHQHAELRGMVGEMQKTITSRPENAGFLGQKLTELMKYLEMHFHEEEAEGFFEQVERHAPRLTTETGQLKDEHKVFLVQVRSMIASVDSAEGTDAWWEQLEKDFLEFGKAIMQHESKENQLLQRAYIEDIGSHD